MNESKSDKYLIWSNEHKAWWRADHCGYSPALNNAGNYTREEAIGICKRALPTAMHVGLISEIPVRLADVIDVLHDEMVPGVVLGKQDNPRAEASPLE
jgi:hypothetical protein